MHDFVSHILRQYFHSTNWNEYNSYLHLTSSSSALLDFPVPTGLSLSISASPTPPFFTTHRLGALPNLRAGIGYIYAHTDRRIDFGGTSKDVRLKEIIERFRIVESRPPTIAKEREYYWLGGERFAEELEGKNDGAGGGGGGEYLVYGCMHVPSARLDALWTKRFSPTWQLIVTAVSTPPKYPLNAIQNIATQTAYGMGSKPTSSGMDRMDSSNPSLSSSTTIPSSGAGTTATATTAAAAAAAAQDTYGLGPPGSTNLQLTLQRDTGRWFTEYSYSIDDALWGFRVLHNFGGPTDTAATTTAPPVNDASPENLPIPSPRTTIPPTPSINAEDTDAGGGLRGRFSAGAEVFISTVEKSAGLSTGIRFSTLPDTPHHPPIITPPSFDTESSPHPPPTNQHSTPSQPPTVITATLNPMMGHLSTAYAARMARDVVVCSRFDFNVYSYESEWTVGAEYWLRKGAPPLPTPAPAGAVEAVGVSRGVLGEDFGERRVSSQAKLGQAAALSLREPSDVLAAAPLARATAESSGGLLRPPAPALTLAPPLPSTTPPTSTLHNILSPITGVLKARISTTSDIRLLWQGRLSHCLVSLGVKADLRGTHRPSSIGDNKMGIVKSLGVEVMYFSQADDDCPP